MKIRSINMLFHGMLRRIDTMKLDCIDVIYLCEKQAFFIVDKNLFSVIFFFYLTGDR